jgi:hypothetical protein
MVSTNDWIRLFELSPSIGTSLKKDLTILFFLSR